MSEGIKTASVSVGYNLNGDIIVKSGDMEVRFSSMEPYGDVELMRRMLSELMASEYERGKVDGAAEKPPTAYKSLFYVSNGGVGFGFATRHTVEAMADAAKRVDWSLLPTMSSVVGEIMPPKPEHENADPDALVAEAIMHMLRRP